MTNKESAYLFGLCVFAPFLMAAGASRVALISDHEHNLMYLALSCRFLGFAARTIYDMLQKLDERVADLEKRLQEKEG